MQVAIPTNDSVNIFKRTGRAPKFVIAEISGNNFSVIKTVDNHHTHDHHENEHEEEHSHQDLVDSIAGCKHIIANMVGKHLKADMMENNIKIFITKEKTIEGGLNDFISHINDK